MTHLSLTLTDAERAFIEAKVGSGAYPSAEAVLQAALALLEADDEIEAEKETRFATLIQEAEDDFAAGRFETVTDVRAWLDGLGRSREEAA